MAGKPQTIRVDNGPEFLALQDWCKEQHIELRFIQPGKPNQNAFIERFNRTFRDDVLAQYLFEDMEQVKELIGKFTWQYNNIRPHDSLHFLTPRAFLLKHGKLSLRTSRSKVSHIPTGQRQLRKRKFNRFIRYYLRKAYDSMPFAGVFTERSMLHHIVPTTQSKSSCQ